MIEKTRRLRRKEASTYLRNEWGISRTPKTLAKQATVGGGPPFEKDGRIPLYTPAGLDDYARSVLSPLVHSTAELAQRKSATVAVPVDLKEQVAKLSRDHPTKSLGDIVREIATADSDDSNDEEDDDG